MPKKERKGEEKEKRRALMKRYCRCDQCTFTD
jgi:hypothetical protein